MLFHICAEFGVCTAMTRYLISATSISWWSWKIDPAARMVLGLRGSCVSELPSLYGSAAVSQTAAVAAGAETTAQEQRAGVLALSGAPTVGL